MFGEVAATIDEGRALMDAKRNESAVARRRIEGERRQSEVTAAELDKVAAEFRPAYGPYGDLGEIDTVVASDPADSLQFGARGRLTVVDPESAGRHVLLAVVGETSGRVEPARCQHNYWNRHA